MQTNYKFQNNQLKSIETKDLRNHITTTTQFDRGGHCEKVSTDKASHTDDFHSTAKYQFNSSFEELDIIYSYSIDITKWDVVLRDHYTFTYDDKKQVIKERKLSTHPESVYGTTITYAYDSIGNIVYSTIIDDCALTVSSNSCSNYAVKVVFDERNNIISKSMDDFTIRNLNISNGYSYSAKYNDNNDLIDERYNSDWDVVHQFAITAGIIATNPGDTLQKPIFEYDYDVQGNWIVKYQNQGGVKTVVRRREIR